MNADKQTPAPKKRRMLRTPEEAFAAGYEHGAKFPPLTEAQINKCAAILAPVLRAQQVER